MLAVLTEELAGHAAGRCSCEPPGLDLDGDEQDEEVAS